MTYDFTLYPTSLETPLFFTVQAESEAAARAELRARLRAIGLSDHDTLAWRVAVTVVRKVRP